MLAAHAAGLGTCPIGFARPWLNLPETKRELSFPDELNAVFPLIIGYPDETPEAPPRNEPQIVAWEVSQLDQLSNAVAEA
jgi:nitroreductase